MSGIRERIEGGFESFAALLCRHRIVAVLAVLLLTTATASGLRSVTIDTSNESFLHPDDPVLSRYEAFRAKFGRDDLILIAVEADGLFTPDGLQRLKSLHEALNSSVPHVANITSMINARNTRGEGDSLIVGDLLESWPKTQADFDSLRDLVLANPLYRNRLISPDGSISTIAIELNRFADTGGPSLEAALDLFDSPVDDAAPALEMLSDEETHEVVAAVEATIAGHTIEGFRLYMAGTPAVTDALKIALQDDMKRFIGLAIGIIALLLFATFRTVLAVVLPLVVVLLALLSTIGLMGHFGTTIKLPTIILPSFLLAVGIGAAVHLLSIHAQRLRAGAEPQQAIVDAVGHAGLPILLTSLTTAAGLGSFAAAEVLPIAELGRYAALGVLIALLYTLVLIPAGLAILPARRIPPVTGISESPGRLDRTLTRVARWGVSNALPVTATSALAALICAGLAVQLRFSHDVLAWLPEDWPVQQATRAIDRKLGGSVALEVLLDTGSENGLHDRETLVRLDTIAKDLETTSASGPVAVGSTLSVADLLKEIHQALNENRSDHYRIPENPKLIPQEFLLFENSGSDDLEDVVDTQFRTARFSMRVPWLDTLAYPPFIRDVQARFGNTFGGDAEITVTGFMSLLSRTLDAAIRSAAQSYLIAFAVITLMMIALIGRIGTGLISMIPNLAPIVLTLALMHLAGIPLNLFTMLVGSIAIGLAVDDTVHFMHHFHRYLARTGNVEEAVRMTLLTSGRAMLATSIILSAGFFIFCFATMSNLIHFGLLTGITILTALAADFLLAPALMALRYRRQTESGGVSQKGDRE